MADEKKTLGQAYVQILPTTEGIAENLRRALGGASEEAGRSAGAGWSSSFGDMLKANLVTEGVKMALDGAKQLGEQVVDLAKTAVDSYADYEQLVGGVETLFKDSADQVQQYAAQAYKTAGLSANEYMETTTSFAASLLQSLNGDTQAAADMANMAVTDMADNANKMGSSMESIQNAYQGFAKQNYTMLDNLKLGYGGTQQEMFRLLQDAAGLNEEFARTANFSIDNKGHLEAGYADIVQAIHIVQDEMGITGTTALEAEHTISGSIASMRSAWANLVTGLADENANFDELVQNFVDSALVAGDNLIPRIGQALTGVGQLIDGLAPVIAETLPEVVAKVGPPLARAAWSIVAALGQALVENAPALFDYGMGLIQQLSGGLAQGIPAFLGNALPMLVSFSAALREGAGQLVDAGLEMLVNLAKGIADGLPALIENLPEIVTNIANIINDNAPKILAAGVQIILTLIVGIIQAIPTLIENIPKIFEAVVAVWSAINWVSLGNTLVSNIANGIKSFASEPVNAVLDMVDDLIGIIRNPIQSAYQWGIDLIANFSGGIVARAKQLFDTVKSIAQGIKNFLGFSEPEDGPLSNFHTYAPDMMQLFAQGIRENEGLVRAQMERSFAPPEINNMRYEPASMPMRLVGVNDGTLRAMSDASGTGSNGRPVTVVLQMNEAEWGRGIFRLYEQEKQRMGVSLVTT